MKDRTRLLVTHQVALVLPQADLVLCLDGAGSLAACCPPSQLQRELRVYLQSMSSAEPSFLEMICNLDLSSSFKTIANTADTQNSVTQEQDKSHLDRGEVVLLVDKEERSVGGMGWNIYWYDHH